MSEAVMRFRGEYDFLSNMYEAPFTWDGRSYRNSEAAFQSAKTLDPAERDRFSELAGVTAKRAGKKLPLREDWEQAKLGIMEKVLRAKFSQNPELLRRLEATGDRELQEGNQWHDTYWGVDAATGRGENHLGRLLMRLRDEARGTIVREVRETERVPREERVQLALAQREEELRRLRAELERFPWPDLSGTELRSKAFGRVTVLRREGFTLYVRAGEAEKRFLLPDCVLGGYLIPEEPELTEACQQAQALQKQVKALERAELPSLLPGPETREKTTVTRFIRYIPDAKKEEKLRAANPKQVLTGTAIFLREGKKLSPTAADTLRHLNYYNEGVGGAVLLAGRVFVLLNAMESPLDMLAEAEKKADITVRSMPDFTTYEMDDGCGWLEMRGAGALSPHSLEREARGSLLPALNLRSECLRACEAFEPVALIYFNEKDCLQGKR